MGKAIIWTNRAKTQLNQIFLDLWEISKSLDIAEKVTSDIFHATEILKENPEMFALDRFKSNNDGNIRAFEKHRYRIIYRNEGNEIHILNIRHTSRKPLDY